MTSVRLLSVLLVQVQFVIRGSGSSRHFRGMCLSSGFEGKDHQMNWNRSTRYAPSLTTRNSSIFQSALPVPLQIALFVGTWNLDTGKIDQVGQAGGVSRAAPFCRGLAGQRRRRRHSSHYLDCWRALYGGRAVACDLV